MTPLRRGCVALAGLALLGALGSAGSTARVLTSTEPGTGTVTSRMKAGFRTWELTVTYPQPGVEGKSRTFATTGYYRGPAYAPGAEVPVRLGETVVRLGSVQELWLGTVFFTLLGGLFAGLVVLTGPNEIRHGDPSEGRPGPRAGGDG